MLSTIPIPFDSASTEQMGSSVDSGVLALNLLAVDGRMILSSDTFLEEDPNTWVPPFRDAESMKHLGTAICGISSACRAVLLYDEIAQLGFKQRLEDGPAPHTLQPVKQPR